MECNISHTVKNFSILAVMLLLTACSSGNKHPASADMKMDDFGRSDFIDNTKSRFPLAHYDQSVDKWVPPDGINNNTLLMDDETQKKYFASLLSRYFGMKKNERSPWNSAYIERVLNGMPEKNRDASINEFLSRDSRSWGENFRLNPESWKQSLRLNVQRPFARAYQAKSRAISVRETLVRVLPTDGPAYHDPKLAGEGYPFDRLQMSSLRPATPIYIIGESTDKNWKYVISPTVIGWVKSDDIALVDSTFITQWTLLAQRKLGAFIKEGVSVNDNSHFYFIARPGTILPYVSSEAGGYTVWVPQRRADGQAIVRKVRLNNHVFTPMPMKMTPANMALLMKSMIGRPYGWGNTLFYNDCSAELLSLMMPFGISLPRNSAAQIKATAHVVDLSDMDTNGRIEYLKKHGKPFTTFIYLPGHIMLYIGNANVNGQTVAMTYNNIWGLRPQGSQGRSIIGGSVILPLLSVYPENPNLSSLAAKSQFKLGFLEYTPQIDVR